MYLKSKCPQCRKTHIVKEDSKEEWKRCVYCQKRFKISENLIEKGTKNSRKNKSKGLESSEDLLGEEPIESEKKEGDNHQKEYQSKTESHADTSSSPNPVSPHHTPFVDFPSSLMTVQSAKTHSKLLTCPHCWNPFGIEDILFIARHQELVGDPLLGPEAPLRFLPSHFTPEGHAMDSQGMPCPDRACPHCHLPIPRILLDVSPFFVSLVGAASGGKSFFLTALIHELRNTMARYFMYSFRDADPTFNIILNGYENDLFFNADESTWVTIQKTQKEGFLYNQIMREGMRVNLSRPFIFLLTPLPQHPEYQVKKEKLTRALIFYDNAGEHFEPGEDTVTSPVTHHLVHSQGYFFLFDPTQDTHFRTLCQGEDPQLQKEGAKIRRQEILLTEMIVRIRRYTGLKEQERSQKPLFICVTKYDLWRHLLPISPDPNPWQAIPGASTYELNKEVIQTLSKEVRALLLERVCPELVYTAESFSKHVRYFPVSALGTSPTIQPETGLLSIQPKEIKPNWVSVPLLTMLGLYGFIPFSTNKEEQKGAEKSVASSPPSES